MKIAECLAIAGIECGVGAGSVHRVLLRVQGVKNDVIDKWVDDLYTEFSEFCVVHHAEPQPSIFMLAAHKIATGVFNLKQ